MGLKISQLKYRDLHIICAGWPVRHKAKTIRPNGTKFGTLIHDSILKNGVEYQPVKI